jgi:NAD-dependent deacetylase
MFLAVGTSGLVLPAAEFVDRATRAGASTWLVDLAPGESRSRFAHVVAGRAAEVLPALLVAL